MHGSVQPIEKQDLDHVVEAAEVVGVSAAAGSAATVLAGDAVAGGAVSGAVVTAHNVLKGCDSMSCAAKESAQGVAGTAAALTTAGIVCPTLGPLTPVFLSCSSAGRQL